MPEPSGAVFLSYASQDAEVVRRIAEALRAAGVEVWFDQSELVGGDAWDAKIRKQIASCALFVPVISAATQARLEAYFRIEWKLAAQRTHAMAEEKAFLLPVMIDDTRDAEARVPSEFKAVQWTRLVASEASSAFCERVKRLLEGSAVSLTASRVVPHGQDDRATIQIFSLAARPPLNLAPAKSIAVLAFANLSPDPENEYFSDGISEDLISVLGRVPGLTVRGRTSAFSFKGKNVPMPEIARQLGVIYVVRGSVRKAGNRVRVSAQLTRAADDEVVWSSEPLEREIKDVFAVQDELVALIAKNLSLKLGAAARVARTIDPEAHRLLLEGQWFWTRGTGPDLMRAETALTKALALAPDFAEAQMSFARNHVLQVLFRWLDGIRGDSTELRLARMAAERAIELDPALPDSLAVLALACLMEGEFEESARLFREALALNPNSAPTRLWHGHLLISRGQLGAAITEYGRAMELEPLWPFAVEATAIVLVEARRFAEALELFARATELRGGPFVPNLLYRIIALRGLGRDAEAVNQARETRVRMAERPRWGVDCAAIEALRHAGQISEAEAYAAELFATLPADATARGWGLAALGRFEEALPLMERATVFVRRGLFWYPYWDPWREDPRFHRFLEKLGCAEDYRFARAELARLSPGESAKAAVEERASP